MYGDSEAYVYVYRSLELLETVGAEMRLRTGLVSAFALVLAFAVSSAVSGWLTRPISEMTSVLRGVRYIYRPRHNGMLLCRVVIIGEECRLYRFR